MIQINTQCRKHLANTVMQLLGQPLPKPLLRVRHASAKIMEHLPLLTHRLEQTRILQRNGKGDGNLADNRLLNSRK